MPRVPKNPPPIWKDFLEFCQKQDKKQLTSAEKKKFITLTEKYWSAFYEKSAAETAKKTAAGGAGAKKTGAKKKDPVSALENAVKQMNEKMVLEGDPEERQRLQEGLAEKMQALVPGLKTAIEKPVASAAAAVVSNEDPQLDADGAGAPSESSNAVAAKRPRIKQNPENDHRGVLNDDISGVADRYGDNVVVVKDPSERAALISEATQLFAHATSKIESADVPAETAQDVKKDVEELYNLTVRAISE